MGPHGSAAIPFTRLKADTFEGADDGDRGDLVDIGDVIRERLPVADCPARHSWDIREVMYISNGDFLMQVGKWGNSLAVRLPSSIVELLELEEGDEIEIEIAGRREFRVGRDTRRQRALAHLKSLNWELPPGFTFSREDANER
jgi:antitoxin MazE